MTNLEAVRRYQRRHPDRVAKVHARGNHRQKIKGWPNRKRWLWANVDARLLASARAAARTKRIACTITKSDIKVPKQCPVFGIPLFLTPGRRTNNTPSIDRINNRRGYVSGNIVVVSWRANHLKSNMTRVELQRLARFYLRRM